MARDEPREAGRLPGLAAADEVLLRAARRTCRRWRGELELSPAQCHVLHLIEPDRPMPMGRLAETLACDASNVTGLVDRLESRGLSCGRPSAEDRRVKVLRAHADRRAAARAAAPADGRAARTLSATLRRRTAARWSGFWSGSSSSDRLASPQRDGMRGNQFHQGVRINRLHQMDIESGFHGLLPVRILPPTGDRHDDH